jgi:spore maturation protein CgeB
VASGPSLRNWLKRSPTVERLNASVKARLQEREAERALRAYQREAARLGIQCPSGQALAAAVRARLEKRRGKRPAKAKGQLHIFLACGVYNWERVLPMALAPFGKVTSFDWRAHGFDEFMPDWLGRREEMNRQMLQAFHAADREQPVDAVVACVSGNNTSPQTLLEMAGAGAAVFNFCWDDKINFPGKLVGGRYTSPAAIASAVDLNLTNAPESVVKYAVHGGPGMFWPEAAHPEVHRPYELPFEFDVTFVGARYGWRPRFIDELAGLGVKVECFGRGWPNGPLSDEEMVKLYSRSRINLGVGGVGHSRKLLCLKGRDFEVPMSGGLYLTQHNPELSFVYDLGREIVTHRDARECAQIIHELLADPTRAAAIRLAGRERSLKDHTYEARWGQVFGLAGLIDGGLGQ